MRAAWDGAWDDVEVLFVVAVAITLLIVLGLVALLVWMLISGLIVMVQYQVFRSRAETTYRQIEDELGLGLDVDHILHSVFGEEMVLSRKGHRNRIDWFEETILGEENDHAA